MSLRRAVLAAFGALLAGFGGPASAALAIQQQSANGRLEGPALRATVLPKDVEIELALKAGPAHFHTAAAVYVFGAHGYVLERKGTSQLTCLVNRDAFLDGYDALKPTCFDPEGTARIIPMILREGVLIAKGEAAAAVNQVIEAAFERGELKPPTRPGIAYMLQGDISAIDAKTGAVLARSHPPHLMFYAPGLTDKDFGFGPGAIEGLGARPFVYARHRFHGYVIITLKQP